MVLAPLGPPAGNLALRQPLCPLLQEECSPSQIFIAQAGLEPMAILLSHFPFHSSGDPTWVPAELIHHVLHHSVPGSAWGWPTGMMSEEVGDKICGD